MYNLDIPYEHPPSARRKGIMLCAPLEEKRLLRWTPPYLVQPKLNGERCRAIHTPEGYILVSSEGFDQRHFGIIFWDGLCMNRSVK